MTDDNGMHDVPPEDAEVPMEQVLTVIDYSVGGGMAYDGGGQQFPVVLVRLRGTRYGDDGPSGVETVVLGLTPNIAHGLATDVPTVLQRMEDDGWISRG